MMFDRIKKLYDSGAITKVGARNAVINKLITAEQYKTITGDDYDE